MLRKSLAIVGFLVLNTAASGWSIAANANQAIDQARGGQTNFAPASSALHLLENKLSEAAEAERYPEVERLARQILRQDPQNRNAILFLGLALKGQKKFTQAESLYRQQIAKNQLDFPMYEVLGGLLQDAEKPEAALIVYRQAIAVNPANSYIDLDGINQQIVYILIKLKRNDEAIAFCRQRLAITNSKLEIFNLGMQLSVLLKQQGDVNGAIAVLREMIAREPLEGLFYRQLGQLLAEQGREAEMIELYQRAIAIPRGRNGTFDRDSSLYLSLGRLLEKQQRLPEALAVYRKLIANSHWQANQLSSNLEQFRTISSSMPPENAEALESVSEYFSIIAAQAAVNELLYRQQGWQAVQREMLPIEQTTPKIAAYILQDFGGKRVAAKQYNDAILAYQQALQLDEQSIGAAGYGNLFLAWTLTNQPQAAKAAYQKALALTPVALRQETIKNWALALDKAGQKTVAIDLYRQFLKSPGKEYLFVSLQLAKALEQSGQAVEAKRIYRQVQILLSRLRRDPFRVPETYTMQGNLFSQLEQRQEAIDSYRKAIALLEQQDKKDGKQLSFNQLKLADNLRLIGRYAEAIDFYQQVIKGCDCVEVRVYEASTLHGMAYYGLGLSFEQQGRFSEAKVAFQKALDLDPSYEEVRNALVRVNSR
jgi:tetratricopeptide (TPR) repeat protein